MEGPNDSRAAALTAASNTSITDGEKVAFAMIYVGDRLGELSDTATAKAIERVATELGSFPRAIEDLAQEVAGS